MDGFLQILVFDVDSFFKYDDQVVLARVKHASVSQVGLEPDNDNSM